MFAIMDIIYDNGMEKPKSEWPEVKRLTKKLQKAVLAAKASLRDGLRKPKRALKDMRTEGLREKKERDIGPSSKS